jgi:hypothetical protein
MTMMPRSETEFVSQRLAHEIGWTHHHDLLALRLAFEFRLRMPRDRELLRQVTMLRFGQPPSKAIPAEDGWRPRQAPALLHWQKQSDEQWTAVEKGSGAAIAAMRQHR